MFKNPGTETPPADGRKKIARSQKSLMEKFYERGPVKLFLGDCVEVLSGARPLSVDMVFADPPYMLSNGGITCRGGRIACVDKDPWDKSSGLDKDFEFHKTWIAACKRVLKPGGTIWITGTYHSVYDCGFALRGAGFKILNGICWYKPNASPNMACRCFTASHETLIWAKKDPKATHVFNYQLMKNGDWRGDGLKRPGRQMRSVWQIGAPPRREKTFGRHPAQKPLELLRRVISASTNAGDLVLDPFTGSSTSGIAALESGRRFVGIDSQREYLELSVRRFEHEFENLRR